MWWKSCVKLSKWSLELDASDAAIRVYQKPTSVVVIDVTENVSEILNWKETSNVSIIF